MKIGVRVPQYGSTWPQIRDAALRVEALGFDGIWVNDHLMSPGRDPREPAFDGLTTLAALAPLTARARLGVAVLSAAYRPAPVAAKAAAVIDAVSGGRMVVGLGTGSDRREHAAYGFPFGTPAERTAGLRRALDTMLAMRDAPDGERPNVPAPGHPIWVAAHKPGLLRLAGERADGVIGAWVAPTAFAERIAIAEAARAAAGRPPLRHCLYTFAFPVTGDAAAWLRPEAEALSTTPEALLRWLGTTGIVGSPAQIAERLGEYAAVGVTDTVLALPGGVPLDALDALAEILPGTA